FVFTFTTINVTSTYEIYEIQSSGLASPYAGQTVTTENNVVTAVGPDGFAMQTPDARDDADPQTSNGIWVYTGGAPSVAVGDHVDVTGEVVEFFDLTEFSNSPSVSLVSAGNPLPAAIELDATTPSPNAPQSSTEYERFEGMLVHIAAGTVTSGNQRFGSDPIAEAFIVASATRPFREPGIAYPGLGGLPVWDGNPEVFELDPDRLGLANTYLVGGSTFEATGVIGYEYSDYELWPTSLSLSNVPTMPGEVRDETSNEITVGSLNVERLLSGASDYSVRLDKLSQFIRLTMKAPDIIAIQEVGGQTELDALAAEILADDAGLNYSTYFVGSNTSSDIFVGYLVRSDIPVSGVEELGAAETYTFGGSTSILHDRPPLKMVAQLAGGKNLTVLNVHLRSLNGIDDPSDGPRVRYKRDLAATSVSNMVQDLQTADPNINLIVLGDFNAFEFTDGYVDVLGQIIGDPADASEALIPGTEVVEPNLTNQVLSAAATNRYSYIYQGSAQVLDHILTSSAMSPYVTGLEFARGNADVGEEYRNDGGATALYSSDHDGVVLYINEDQLIPVELTTFAASAGDGFIELAWSTASESENMGFNVYRSESENGQYLKINEEIIAGQGNSASGASYSFQDSDVLSGNTYFYKIADVSFNGEITFHGPVSVNYTTTSVSNGAAELPSEFKLMQNYPNPFNPATTIGFALPEAADVTLRIYNVLGVEVRTLAENKAHNAGEITYTWDARNNDGQLLNSGVYYVRIETGTFTATKKMVYLR
ncbi:MAG: T9SS C-terminal target domain-containing protein, partial [Calditrichaeota bacterium]